MKRADPKLPLLLLGLTAAAAWAQNQDSKEPIQIEADSAIYDEGKGEAIYEGNVQVIQGGLTVHGQHMVVTLTDGNASKVVTTGSPVRMRQKARDGSYTHSTSDKAEYYPAQDLLVLIGHAEVIQKRNIYRSDRIEYELATQLVRAGQKTKGGTRVQIILKPAQPAQP